MVVLFKRNALIRILTLVLGLTVLLGPAASRGAETPERASTVVSLSGVDLKDPTGVALARSRVEDAAKRLCRRFYDSRRVSSQQTYVDCVHDTLQAALVQVEQSAPVAVAAAPVAAPESPTSR